MVRTHGVTHEHAISIDFLNSKEYGKLADTSYRGLSLLVDLNWDRALYFGFLIIALTAGAWIGA